MHLNRKTQKEVLRTSVTNNFLDRTLKPGARTNLTGDKSSHTGG